MIPELAELDLPSMSSASIAGLRARDSVATRLPAIRGGAEMSQSRAIAAAQYAADVGAAYFFIRRQKAYSRANARIEAQMLERQSRRDAYDRLVVARSIGRAERQNEYQTARAIARALGMGTDIFKKAKL